MSDLRQLLRSAAFNPGPLDLSELRRRIIRRRRRRAATVVVTSVVAVTVMVGVFATVAAGDHHSEARVETSADSTVPVDATTSSSVGATSTTAAPTAPIVPTDTTTRTTPPQTSPPQSVVTAPVVITTPATVPTPITTPPSTEPPTTTTTTVPRPAACSTTPIGVAIYPTQAAFEAAITGRWFLCNTPSIFFTSNEIGLELTADHHWKKLFGSFDAPTLGNDPSDYGTWLSLDVTDMNGPGSYQINLVNNHRGTISTIPIISANGTRMRVDNNGDNFTDYVRVS